MSQQPPSQALPEEKAALQKVMWFGILQVVGLVSGWVVSFYVFGTVFSSYANFKLPPNPTPAQVSAAMGPLFQGLSLVVPVALVIQLVALIILTLGLRELRRADRGRFSVPSTLMILMLVGVVIAAIGLVPLFNSIPNIIATAPTSGASPSSAFASAIASLLAYVALLAIGGLLAFIGLIGGQILGLWRVGSRYNETTIKLGAIFVIIPLLNIIGPILIIVGAYQAKGRLAGTM